MEWNENVPYIDVLKSIGLMIERGFDSNINAIRIQKAFNYNQVQI